MLITNLYVQGMGKLDQVTKGRLLNSCQKSIFLNDLAGKDKLHVLYSRWTQELRRVKTKNIFILCMKYLLGIASTVLKESCFTDITLFWITSA